MYLAGVSVRRVEDITEALWGTKVSILIAIGVGKDGCSEIIGAAEGMKRNKESWRSLFVSMKERGLCGVRLIKWGVRRYMNMDHLINLGNDLLSDDITG